MSAKEDAPISALLFPPNSSSNHRSFQVDTPREGTHSLRFRKKKGRVRNTRGFSCDSFQVKVVGLILSDTRALTIKLEVKRGQQRKQCHTPEKKGSGYLTRIVFDYLP